MMKTRLFLGLGLVTVGLALAPTPGVAQYYPPGPGYYPPPPPRDPYYYRPEYRREPVYGAHCDAVMRTPYGPRQLFCRIVEPKPLGMECACPPPPPPPGYAPGPFVPGRTVR